MSLYVLSNFYIESTEGNLQMRLLWAVATLYTYSNCIALVIKLKKMTLSFIDSALVFTLNFVYKECHTVRCRPITKPNTVFLIVFVSVIVLNATFNNISAISWRSVLLVEETRVPEVNHRRTASQWHITCCIKYASLWAGFELTPFVVICTELKGRCKFNYNTIKTTMASCISNVYLCYLHLDIV